jgi:pyroglutamyl-peptidase
MGTEPVILLTGFEPFGGETINPSWEVARELDGALIAGARVAARQLPCSFGMAAQVMRRCVMDLRPSVALALGQASGRADFSIERVAINVDDARIADNEGAQPIDQAIAADGPVGYFSTLPIKAIVAGLRAAGMPASVSQTAGTFVCNHVFYALMHDLRRHPAVHAGFMHLPMLPQQAARHPGLPCLPLTTLVEGVHEVLRIAISHRGGDLVLAEGQIA